MNRGIKPVPILARAYRAGWIEERKRHLCWRAIARRATMRATIIAFHAAQRLVDNDLDGETDP